MLPVRRPVRPRARRPLRPQALWLLRMRGRPAQRDHIAIRRPRILRIASHLSTRPLSWVVIRRSPMHRVMTSINIARTKAVPSKTTTKLKTGSRIISARRGLRSRSAPTPSISYRPLSISWSSKALSSMASQRRCRPIVRSCTTSPPWMLTAIRFCWARASWSPLKVLCSTPNTMTPTCWALDRKDSRAKVSTARTHSLNGMTFMWLSARRLAQQNAPA